MKKVSSIFFYVSISMIVLGLVLRSQHWNLGNKFFFLGLFCLIIYLIVKTIKGVSEHQFERLNGALYILLTLMSITFYAKYLNHTFWDYPCLIVTPIFIVLTLFYLIKYKIEDVKLIIVSFLYLILVVPLFGVGLYPAPRQFIPKEWYNNRYDVGSSTPIDLPYKFRFKRTENLSVEAHSLKKSGHYYDAINIYKQAMEIEPENPRIYFDLSECYARVDKLEYAKALMDKAIQLDSSFAGSYSNRGLIYYKLNKNKEAIKDYQKAISLDSTQSTIFANLALVYYYEKDYYKSCKSMRKAEQLGLDIETMIRLRNVIRINCD